MKKIGRKISSEWAKYARVWRLLRKPTLTEFKMISKVTVIGLLIIGALGFLISISMTAITKLSA